MHKIEYILYINSKNMHSDALRENEGKIVDWTFLNVLTFLVKLNTFINSFFKHKQD